MKTPRLPAPQRKDWITEMTTSPAPRRFVRILLAGILLTLLGFAAFNALMDPFALFGSPRIAGLNADKAFGDVRMTKAWAVARGHYDSVILGTSRSEVGLNPGHPAWRGLQVYNLAMPGASLYEIYRNLQHAQAAHPLKQVVIGLDFFNFSIDEHAPETFAEARLLVDRNNRPQQNYYFLRDTVNVLFSQDAFRKSLENWRTNHYGAGPTHSPLGQVSQQRWFNGVRNEGGFRAAFHDFERNYMRKGGNWLKSPEGGYRFSDPRTGESTFKTYEQILVFCREHHIRLVMVLSPIHARLQLGLYVTGLWDEFADWKRLLAARNEAVARRFGEEPYVLMDFATINAYTQDPLPENETRDTISPAGMRWYWDSAHYRSVLGDLVQDRALLGKPAPEDPGFGQPLATATVEGLLETQRQALRSYRISHPRDWDEIVDLARSLKTLKAGAVEPVQ